MTSRRATTGSIAVITTVIAIVNPEAHAENKSASLAVSVSVLPRCEIAVEAAQPSEQLAVVSMICTRGSTASLAFGLAGVAGSSTAQRAGVRPAFRLYADAAQTTELENSVVRATSSQQAMSVLGRVIDPHTLQSNDVIATINF